MPLYVERVVPTYLDFEFRKLFRLSRSTCGALVEEYQRSNFYPEGFRGRPKISTEKTLLVALAYLSTQQTKYQIADNFDVSESTIHAAISCVVDFLDSISAREICWPDRDERERNMRAFKTLVRRRSGLPDVVGAIDGHVRIARPTESEQSYYNRKKFHYIILQGVYDADMMFIDVFIGIPGELRLPSAPGQLLLRRSNGEVRSPFPYRITEPASAFNYIYRLMRNVAGGYLVGDAAYPLKMWLLPSYRHTTAKWEIWMTAFNYAHTRQRHQAGSANVLASCVLHNMARRCGDIVEFDLEVSDSGTDLSSAEPAEGDDSPTRSAAAFRDGIAQSLLSRMEA
ncbi:hypothetical protein HPB52_013484 [Rhipicephalus sanguineus]|uniref:Transposase Helix-turn-helix domain-containing protein n=1 Tax=Rhipicephalus sanguineus TaxID=34632 RepID=A0A9D4PFH7_RHISA|nr:hypothetical protein HPB52_013484 [Rhipicephalus sanguineus]